MPEHPYKVKLGERLFWILVMTENPNSATHCFQRLLWYCIGSLPLKTVPVHLHAVHVSEALTTTRQSESVTR
jgi:hypothetical protein